jgi:hypothetical protein
VNSSAATIFVDLEVWRASGGRSVMSTTAVPDALNAGIALAAFPVQRSVMSRLAASDARFRVCARLYSAAMITTGAAPAAPSARCHERGVPLRPQHAERIGALAGDIASSQAVPKAPKSGTLASSLSVGETASPSGKWSSYPRWGIWRTPEEDRADAPDSKGRT